MASCLPPARQEPPKLGGRALGLYLDQPDQVQHLAVAGQSVFEPVEIQMAEEVDEQAIRVGSIWLKGPENEWMPGEALKLRGDSRVWRVLQVAELKVKLIFDSRRHPLFRWVRKAAIGFDQRHAIAWPVYNIDGVARALRHSFFAPSDLYLDTRCSIVRGLSSTEKWRMCGLSNSKAKVSIANGQEHELGPLARNSIPTTMTKMVAEDEAERVAKFCELRDRRKERKFVLMPPMAGLYSKKWCATFLIFVSLASSTVLVWDQDSLPGMVHEASRQQAFELACSWGQSLGRSNMEHCVLLQKDMGASVARSVIWYGQEMPSLRGAQELPIAEVMHLPIGELAVGAIMQVRRMVSEVMEASSEDDRWHSGRVAGTAAFEYGATTTSNASHSVGNVEGTVAFQHQVKKHEADVNDLRAILKADHSEDMCQWEQMLSHTDMQDFPEALKRPMPQLSWSGALIPNPHVPVQTDWQPLPKQANLPKRDAPQGWLLAVRPSYRQEAMRMVLAFQKKLTRWLAGKCERPSAIVILGSWLEHWVFEAPHDFHSEPGYAVPVKVGEASKSHLNLDFCQQWEEGYPDQELIRFPILKGTIHGRSTCPNSVAATLKTRSSQCRQNIWLKQTGL